MSIYLRIRDGMDNATEGDIRGLISDILGQDGVYDLANDHLLVEENDTPGMLVTIAPGVFYVPNNAWSEFSSEIKYWDGLLDAEASANISSNPAGSIRIDLITMYVNTAIGSDANASNVATIVVVEGTPGAGAPAVPNDSIALAEVEVAPGETSITDAEITDVRDQAYVDIDLPLASDIKAYVDAVDITKLIDSNGLDALLTEATVSAINEITVKNAAIGTAPKFKPTGDDTNIDLELEGKGTGTVKKPLSTSIQVENGTISLVVGDGQAYLSIPQELDGMDLVGVYMEVIAAGTTNTTDVQIRNVTQAADMLSTKLTIDSGETKSSTAATPAVIDAANDDVAENDLLAMDIDQVSTTPPTGLVVRLRFA